MFRRLTERLSSAVLGEDPKVQRLVAMGFDAPSAANALEACNGNVDRAAELLLSSTPPTTATTAQSDEEATLQRIMQESYQMEQQRRKPTRTAAMNKAAQAAERRSAGERTTTPTTTTRPVARPTVRTTSGGLSAHHPDVKLIPKLQDKSTEEQILRCADRLKSSPQAVDTLYRALTAVQQNPENAKFRKIDKTTAGYQRSLANAPGAEDLLSAMNYRPHGTQSLVLDRGMVDPALLYLGVSALEQTKATSEYKQGKAKIAFAKQVLEIQQLANSSEAEAIQRAALMAKCPTEPAEGRGALMQVVFADETLRRRFDGDDTLQDVLNWLGAHGTPIPEKLQSREWSLVDLNRYPVIPIDCEANQHQTLQFLGCWPSGRLEVLASDEEWRLGFVANVKAGSSRGLGSAPSDVVYQS